MCFGTFDNLHLGHLSYLRQGKQKGHKLIVVVARNNNVKKIKGKFPQQDEKLRLDNIKNINFVTEAVLGDKRDFFKVIKKYKPDIICLGYDQKIDLKKLKRVSSGKIIRLKPFKKNIYKSSKLGKAGNQVFRDWVDV